jgi:hypothetical protein
MTIQEAVLKQVAYLRQCQDERKRDSQIAADTYAELKRAKAIAQQALLEGLALDSAGRPLKLTNDISRKAYIDVHSSQADIANNRATRTADDSASKVELERSVLSAIKDLRGDAELDISHLTKYDI